MQYESVTFISGNKGKIDQVKKHLLIPFDILDLDLPEMQTLDIHELVSHKAKSAYRAVQKPVLVEDTSLVFHALGRLPGPFIKWFAKELKNEGLITLLQPFSDKSASATVTFALYDGIELHIFDSVLKGTIAESVRGENGFGWDPIFIPEGSSKTIAQMNDEEIDALPVRRVPLKKIQEFLTEY